jgi:hypothetical protein
MAAYLSIVKKKKKRLFFFSQQKSKKYLSIFYFFIYIYFFGITIKNKRNILHACYACIRIWSKLKGTLIDLSKFQKRKEKEKPTLVFQNLINKKCFVIYF